MVDTRSMDPSENLAKTLGDRTLAEMKTLAPGAVRSESTSTAFSHSAEKRQKQVSPAYHAAARSLDAELDLDSLPGSPGPVGLVQRNGVKTRRWKPMEQQHGLASMSRIKEKKMAL